MAIFKRGRVYWYHFYFSAQHIQKSTKQGNPQQFRNFSRGKLRTAVSPRVTRWDKRALRSRSIFTA